MDISLLSRFMARGVQYAPIIATPYAQSCHCLLISDVNKTFCQDQEFSCSVQWLRYDTIR